ncbi:hypothetical protein [Actinacidiphila glaucinigra]|uniref:hypothetical protein n=1 Tax=Actinacidiphila glaucinigra TaxID=235986 RepID=UPI0036721DAB
MHVTFQGAARARLLTEIRALREFHVGRAGIKVELEAIYSDPETKLSWIECHTGRYRLPAKLYPWAEMIEDRAREVVGHADIFPCWAVFEESRTGEIQVEIFPEGYESPCR